MEDFNYGTLLRLDCEKDYSEDNTIFGELGMSQWTKRRLSGQKVNIMFLVISATRVQFFAVEIARNREGHNDTVFTSKRAKS